MSKHPFTTEAGGGSRLEYLPDDLEAKPLTSSRETALKSWSGTGHVSAG